MSINGYTLSPRAAAAERRSRGGVTLRAVAPVPARTANDDERVTADEPTGGIRISESVKLAARYGARLTATPSQTFSVCQAAPGVLPSGVTMDSVCGPDVGALSAWAMQGQFHEGLAFPGFPYLAELAQRTEYRHIASIYAEHATRKNWKLTGPDEKVKALETFLGEGEGGVGAVAAFREAIEHDGLFGRSQIYLDFDDADDDAELAVALVLKPEKVSRTRPLKRLKVVEAMWSYPGGYGTSNPLRQDWYKPSIWYVNAKQVHDTRMLTIVGHEVPDILKPAYAFAGLSRTQMAKAYCDNWLRTRQSVSDMTSAYSHLVLSTSLGETLQGGIGPAATGVFDRVDMMNTTRDNRGAWVIDKDTETLTNVAVPLSGLDKLQAQSQEQLAAAARIPLSIYLQITPNGLNASSENEIRSFYADIKGYQEKILRKPLQYLLDVAQLSLFDAIDAAVGFEFLDLWETSALDQSTIDKNEAETDQVLVTIGAFSNEEVRHRHVNDEHSPYFKVAGPAPELPEPEPTPTGTGAQDAAPRPLYVRRDVLNVAEIRAWADKQNIPNLADDLHVTVAYSTEPVDWIAMGADYRDADGKGGLVVAPGGPRVIEPLGDQSGVLLFASSDLSYRNRQMREDGASWDHPDYQPHISLTKEPFDIAKVDPYRGKIEFGPEIFEPIKPKD